MMSVIWPDKAAVFTVAETIIKAAEGLRLKAYLCPAGVWTIGWGCTRRPDGHAIEPGQVITLQEAEEYLQASMGHIWAQLQASGAVTRTPNVNQAAALLSLAYNIGVGVHDGVKGDLADSSLLASFDAGNDAAAAQHFLDWDKARVNGVLVVLPGLVTRRTTERDLFLKAAA